MKATEANKKSNAVEEARYKAVMSMIDLACLDNKKEVRIDMMVVSNDLINALSANGYTTGVHTGSSGVFFHVSWEDCINVETRDKMIEVLHDSSDSKLRCEIAQFYSGKPRVHKSSYIDAVFRGDLKSAARLCGLDDFQKLLRIQAILV